MGTIVVGGVLLLVVAWIVRGMVKKRISGKISCGGDCGHCSGCH